MREGNPMSDRIEILGVRGFGYHGVLESERKDGQEFIVDIVLGVRLADLQDDLTKTIDYSVIAERAHDVIVGEPCQLIETVAERIVDTCRDIDSLEFIEVAVHKPSAPISVPFDDVIVRLRRDFE
jgi:dihydroneopterin aldolase